MIKIKRNKIVWIIEERRVVAFDSLQATSYSLASSNLKKDLNSMKRELKKTDIGNNWVEVIELAAKHNLIGSAIKIDRRWFDE